MQGVQLSSWPASQASPSRDLSFPQVVLVAVSDPTTAAALGIVGARLAVRNDCAMLVFTVVESRHSVDPSIGYRENQRLAVHRAVTVAENYGVPCDAEVILRRFEWPALSRRHLVSTEIADSAHKANAAAIVLGSPIPYGFGRSVAQQLRQTTSAYVVEVPHYSGPHDALGIVQQLWV